MFNNPAGDAYQQRTQEEAARRAEAEAQLRAQEEATLYKPIFDKHAAAAREEIEIERAKSDAQREYETLNGQLATLAAKMEPMWKNPTMYKNELPALEAEIKKIADRQKQLEREINAGHIDDALLNMHGASRK